MSALFGDPNSFLGGDDDDLPLVVGSTIEAGSESERVVLVCHSCETSYALPDEIDDAKLFEMCPRCVHVFSSRGAVEQAEQAPALSHG